MTGAEPSLPESPLRPRRDTQTLYVVALCLIIAVATWFLLQQLAVLLRPLCLAIFLSYALLPLYNRVKEKIPGPAAYVVMAIGVLLILGLIVLLVMLSVVELREEMPGLFDRGKKIAERVEEYLNEHAPGPLEKVGASPSEQSTLVGKAKDQAYAVLDNAANAVAEGVVVVVYLLFFMLESQRFPNRVRNAFSAERAEQILAVLDRINDAIARYVKVKVKASLILAVPVTLILWIFGVKFPLLWGVLTFFCNFIPYLGSVIACSLPLLLTFLQKDLDWQPFAVAVLVIGTHMASAYFIEPTMTGRAVGLSPLIILAALAFWGHVWGLIGLFLAVPLTAIVKIVLENVAFTRPFARLLGEE